MITNEIIERFGLQLRDTQTGQGLMYGTKTYDIPNYPGFYLSDGDENGRPIDSSLALFLFKVDGKWIIGKQVALIHFNSIESLEEEIKYLDSVEVNIIR